MSSTVRVNAPIGPEAKRWTTVPFERAVLVIVHTVTSANRIDDILPMFESDARVQIVFTAIGASAISEGVVERLEGTGRLTIPWDQAIVSEFDLAIAVNHSGELWRVAAPLAIMSHGIGYTKYGSPDRRIAGSPDRRIAGYGISPASLLHEGRPFVDALVLSHEEQRARLAAVVPEALPAAVVAGDPCYDRMRASRPFRDSYRRALGIDDAGTVVTISSTWGAGSLLHSWPAIAQELLAELPVDTFRVVLILHPNVWFAHGRWQLLNWLAEARRAGLTVIDPHAGWQQAILASDVVVGDHGAVTGYAAALGIPTLLGVARSPDVVPGTAIAALMDTAPRLDRAGPLLDQVITAGPLPYPMIANLVSEKPDRSAGLVRETCYRLMGLAAPATEPVVHPYPAEDLPPGRPAVSATWVDGDVDVAGPVPRFRLSRLPADVRGHRSALAPDRDAHLVVTAGHPRPDLRADAAIVLGTEHPTAPHRLVAVIEDARTCRVTGGGDTVTLRYATRPHPDPAILASVVHLWTAHGHRRRDLPVTVLVDPGGGAHRVHITHDSAPARTPPPP